MPLTNLARRLMRRAVRTPASAPIRKRTLGRGMEQLEDRVVPANVAVFDNPAIVDTIGTPSSESDNIQASLVSLGHTVTTFTGLTGATITPALTGRDLVVIPEQENGNLFAALDASGKAAFASFVSGGGGMIVTCDYQNFLNGIFGYTLSGLTGIGTSTLTAAAAGTQFAGGPATLPNNNGSGGFIAGSLPVGGKDIYTSAGVSAVSLIPQGSGRVVHLAWDWFDAAPVGAQNGGWLPVLGSAVTQVASAPPLIYRTSTDPGAGIGQAGFEVYNTVTNTWTARAPYQTDSQMAVGGGTLYARNEVTGFIQSYNPGADTWANVMAGPIGGTGLHGNLEVTTSGRFFFHALSSNLLYYTTSPGVWSSVTMPSALSTSADYDPTTNAMYISGNGSTAMYRVDATTLAVTTYSVGAVGQGEVRRFGEVLGNTFFSAGDFGTTTVFRRDITNPSAAQTTSTLTLPIDYPSAAADAAAGVIYMNNLTGTAPFRVWNPTTNVLTTLASPINSLGNHSTIALVGGAVSPPPPATDDYDDAAASYGTAQHTATGVQLGAARDTEGATFDTATANGDDTTGTDDEDGVVFGPLAPGGQGTVTVTVTGGSGLLQGWVDWNNDGVFGGGEQIITNGSLGSGTYNFPVPAGAVVGNLVSRFRISTVGGIAATGTAPNGEVEDHIAVTSVPTTVYVSPGFTTPGAVVDGDLTAGGVQSATVGYNAFPTIGLGHNVVATNGTLIVNTASYPESPIISKALAELRSYGATVNALTVNAPVGLSGTFNSPGPQAYNAPVTLAANTTTNSTGSTVTFASTVNAGSTGGGGTYTLSTPAFNFIDISGTGTLGPTGDDQVDVNIPIGFTFNYFGTNQTLTALSTNGYINPTNNGANFLGGSPMPNPGNPGGIIAAWWADLYPPAGGTVRYQTVGAPGSRIFIAQWTNVGHFSDGAGPSTFQIQLHETTNLVEIHLPNAAAGNGYNHTIGLQDATGTIGTNAYSGVAGLLANTAYRFTPGGASNGATLTTMSAGATAFNGVVGGTAALGSLTATAGAGLTAGAITTTGATALTFGQGGGSTATLNGPISATTATVTGGPAADTIFVNATAASPVLTANGAGGGDGYIVNAGAAQLGTVAIADTGGSGDDVAALVGTAAAETFNLNNPAAGARTATVSSGGKLTYTGGPVTLERLFLTGSTGAGDAFNISYANPLLAGSALPTQFVSVNAGTGTDTATLTGTSNPDAININSTTTRRVILGSENVDYTTALESLVVNGGNEAGLNGDTFTVTPDSPTAITINGGDPLQPTFPGDTLILNALGLTGAAITPNPAYPNGQVTSTNKATVAWTGIETFPVPLGFGGTFDFDAVRTTQTQPGWFSVLPSDTLVGGFYSFANVGWVNSPLAYDRDGTNGYFPPPGPLSKMWRDGAWGFQGPSEARDFRVSVQANQPIQITALLGDVATINDHVDILVSDGGAFTLLNPSPDTFQNSLDKGFKFVSYSGEYTPTTTSLTVRIRDNAGNYYWTIAGLDVRPLSLRAPITITRADANGSPVEADGLTVDTYNAIGAPGPVLVTVAPQYGTPVGVDADPMTAGFQVTAAADGSFSFQVRRSTGEGPSVVTASDVGGGSKGTFTQTYFLPNVRRIDFGPVGSPVAVGEPITQPYIGVAGEQYTSRVANALGWVGDVTAVDRATGTPLQRDLVYGTAGANRDFVLNMPGPGTYFVTVVLGDAGFARDGMFVSTIDPTSLAVTGTPVTGVSTPVGQSVSRTFTATADANGAIRLRFGDNAGDLFWTLQALEVRPTQGAITITGATSVPADGTTLTTFTLSGATPNTLVTVTASAGQITTPDAGASYVGFQVLTNGSGGATFVVESPQATSNLTATLTADETTGARVAAPYTVTFTGTGGGPGGGGTTAFRFDFNGPTPFNTPGFVSVRGSDTFSTLAGYGWTAAQSEFERTAASVAGKGVVASQVPLYQDGAWGFGSGVFQVAVTKNETNLAARIYVGDSYTNWPYISLLVEGGTPLALNTSATPFGAYTLTGSDANGDGKWDITISSGYVWVVNGIDVASGGSGNLPALPQAAAPGRVALDGDVVTGSELAPVVAAAIDRLAAAGNLTAAQVAQLQNVRFVVGDLPSGHLGEHVGGLVRLDADAGGRGWFVDATPMDDAEFTPVSATEALGGRGVDLLTVVMHELSHELGATDMDAGFEPDGLMTESLGAGVRRLPNGGSWALSVGVQLPVAEAVAVVGPVTGATVRPVAVVKDETTWADAPAVAGAVWSWADAPARQPDWFADDLLGGVRVG